jgi:hypothetical protein
LLPIALFSGILASKQYFVGTQVDETVYHVLLEGRPVGPYSRRTIVGMRIKQTLTSDHVLIGSDGAQLTVAALIGQRAPQPFHPERSSSFSVVQAIFSASLVEIEGRGRAIPKFRDEVQVRVQGDVLRMAGRFRKGLRWKEDRVKIPLKNVVHARVTGSQVELWLRPPGVKRLRRIALELFTHESAAELVEWLPGATPFPQAGGSAGGLVPAGPVGSLHAASRGLWVAVGGVTLVVALMLTVLLLRRVV